MLIGKGSATRVFLLSIFLLACAGKAAAYDEDGRVHFEIGFQTLERDVTESPTQFKNLNFPADTATAQSLRLLGKLSVQVVDPLEIYVLAGGSNLQIDDFHYHSDLSGAYGGGARLVLYQERDRRVMPYQIFADYRFLRYKTNDMVRFAPTDDNGDLLTDELLRERIQWTEHLIKIGIMGRHQEFEPYGGVEISFIRGKDRIPSQIQSLTTGIKQSNTLGVFAGTLYYLSPSEKAALFIEASLFDQYSLAGGFRLGF